MKTSIKKLLIIVLAAMPFATMAQMQGYTSTERYSRNINPRVNSVKSLAYKQNIITLCYDNQNSYFLLTSPGSNTIKQVSFGSNNANYEIFDFQIVDDIVYFCGQNFSLSEGFISWIKIEDLFSSATFNFDKYKISSNYLKIIYKLSVYNDPNNKVKINALGYDMTTNTYYFIDFERDNPYTWTLFKTGMMLADLVETKSFINILGDIDVNHFCLFRHDKANIQNYSNSVYRYNNASAVHHNYMDLLNHRFSAYSITEFDKQTSENLFVCIDLEDHIYNGSYKPYIFNIDMNNFSVISTKFIPTEGKPLIKDLVYDKKNNLLYMLVNTQYYNNSLHTGFSDIDIIYEMQPSSNITGIIMPNNSIQMQNNLNSITLYEENKYYLVSGKSSSSGTVYWFDNKTTNHNSPCFNFSTEQVYNGQLYQVGNIQYNSFIDNVNTLPIYTIPAIQLYNISCQ